MIKFENTEVSGWKAAIRGMRNPMNSWEKSDSIFGIDILDDHCEICNEIGETDMKLMQNLIKAGTDHSKFMRMINVTVDITAPMYWWKEFDTYKVGTVRNSCSTMHKIHAKEFGFDDFSHEHLTTRTEPDSTIGSSGIHVLTYVIEDLNEYRRAYLETKDKKYWWQMIQLLPSSYNQRATVQLNYAVLRAIYRSDRKNHKLDEWRIGFMEWIESLPYSQLITGKVVD